MRKKGIAYLAILIIIIIHFLLIVGQVLGQKPPLDPIILESVWLVQRDDISTLGTGFLAIPEGHDPLEEAMAFVSNKHILQGKSHILLRINKTPEMKDIGKRDFIRLRVDFAPSDSIIIHYFSDDSAHITTSYYEHSSDSVDVACFLVPSWFILPNMLFPTPNNIQNRIELGDPVFILTYPMSAYMPYMVGKSRNLPMVRGGIVSRILNEPLPTDDKFLKDVILIDAQIFSGNSGSPVILNTERKTDRGTMYVRSLIGMIVGHFPMFDKTFEVVTHDKLDTINVSKQNYGIAVVQQSDKILETLKQIPEFGFKK